MNALVQVPWQPECWLTPDTLNYLIAAGNELHTQLRINGSDGAWRAYADQKALRDYYLEDPKDHPFAADPDTGQRNHMRGAAFDLVRTDAAAQAACRKVGLVRDESEPWHWNNPRWATMPIIPTNDALTAAAFSSTPLPAPKIGDPEMNLFKQTQGNETTFILFAPNADPQQHVFQTTTNVDQANMWAVFVGHDAIEVTSPQVVELANVGNIFWPGRSINV